jgi:hypothetical protein
LILIVTLSEVSLEKSYGQHGWCPSLPGQEALWEALDFSWNMSFRVTKINNLVNCTYAYSLVTVAFLDTNVVILSTAM